MEKINVEVLVPAIGKKYEFILPSVMKVGAATGLIAQAVAEQEGIRAGTEKPLLCLKGKECLLQNNQTIEKAGIRDGNILLLV